MELLKELNFVYSTRKPHVNRGQISETSEVFKTLNFQRFGP